MTIGVRVQTSSNDAAGLTSTIVISGGVQAGSALILDMGLLSTGIGASTPSITAITDTSGNTWSRVVSRSGSSGGNFYALELWAALNVAVTASLTITVTKAGGGSLSRPSDAWHYRECTGVRTSTALEPTTTATANSTALDSGAITTVYDNDMAFGAALTIGQAFATPMGGGSIVWADGGVQTVGNLREISSRNLNVPPASSVRYTDTLAAAAPWVAVATAFRRAPAVLSFTVADAGVATDVDVAKTTMLLRTTDNAVGVDDAQRRVADIGRGTDNAVSTDDAQRRITDSGRTTDNSVAADDDQRRLLSFTRAPLDTAAPGDGDVRLLTQLRRSADTSATSDVTAAVYAYQRYLVDTAAGALAGAGFSAGLRSTADTATAAELLLSRALLLLRQIANTASSSDSTITAARGFARTAQDTVGTAEALGRLVVVHRLLSDVASTADTQHQAVASSHSTGDGVGAVDVATRLLILLRIASDTTATADVTTRAFSFVRALVDSSATAEALRRLLLLLRAPAEPAGGSDDSSWHNPHSYRTLGDSAGTSDDDHRSLRFVYGTDDVVLADDFDLRSLVLIRSTANEIIVPDQVAWHRLSVVATSDMASAFDVSSRLLVQSFSASDAAGTSEALLRLLLLYRTVDDGAATTDALLAFGVSFSGIWRLGTVFLVPIHGQVVGVLRSGVLVPVLRKGEIFTK